MYHFPSGLYTDVRIEDVFETILQVTLGEVEERKEKTYRAAFVRLYDGRRWTYAATSDLNAVQAEIDELAAMAAPEPAILEHPAVRAFEANQGELLRFVGEDDVSRVPQEKKFALLAGYWPLVDGQPDVVMWRANYVDRRVVKHFLSSKGADLRFDAQRAGFRLTLSLADGEKKLMESFDRSTVRVQDLYGLDEQIAERYKEARRFLHEAVEIVPGRYTTVLSPLAAGVFAHESFGHKSEADFMLGDETMAHEWQIGKSVGTEMLSIVDDGSLDGSGYTPYDDEGTRATKTYLIRRGKLDGRLHNSVTAASLEEALTGNARAKDFEYEPIVRQTTTYIEPGDLSFEELLAPIQEGVLVKTIKHGSGMSTFTLAPSLAYMIRDGRIAEPVKVSVVTGNVFEALGQIDGLSDELELLSFTLGGCGKMEQGPLPVGFGGPWVRVHGLNVQ